MNIIGETFLRHCLKPRVECDLPGRLRLRFRHSFTKHECFACYFIMAGKTTRIPDCRQKAILPLGGE